VAVTLAAEIRQTISYRFWDGVATHAKTLPAATYFLTGLGGAEDLIVALNAAAAPHVAVWSMGADGRVSVATVPGTEVRFALADQVTRNILGWRGVGALNVPAGGSTAPYRSGWGLRLHHLTVDDIEIEEHQTSVRIADAASYAVWTGHRVRRRIRIMYRGQPRSSTASDEQYGVRHLWRDSIGRGIPFRYYPDRSVTTERDPHVPALAPWGYQTYRLTSPTSFAPSQVVSGWQEWWTLDLEGVEL
jgi:hypothetical protein